MNKVAELKQRMQHLVELSTRMKQQLDKLKGAQGVEMRNKAKEAGTRMGIGAGISVFGLAVLAVASVYIIAVVILLINIALDRLWLSALIVVPAFLLAERPGPLRAGGLEDDHATDRKSLPVPSQGSVLIHFVDKQVGEAAEELAGAELEDRLFLDGRLGGIGRRRFPGGLPAERALEVVQERARRNQYAGDPPRFAG